MNKIGTLLLAAFFIVGGIIMIMDQPQQFNENALYRHTKSMHGQTYYDRIESGAELASKEPARSTGVNIFGVVLIIFGSLALWVYYKDYIAKPK